jgi:hypothetical protein
MDSGRSLDWGFLDFYRVSEGSATLGAGFERVRICGWILGEVGCN